jgi:hypothetical protein
MICESLKWGTGCERQNSREECAMQFMECINTQSATESCGLTDGTSFTDRNNTERPWQRASWNISFVSYGWRCSPRDSMYTLTLHNMDWQGICRYSDRAYADILTGHMQIFWQGICRFSDRVYADSLTGHMQILWQGICRYSDRHPQCDGEVRLCCQQELPILGCLGVATCNNLVRAEAICLSIRPWQSLQRTFHMGHTTINCGCQWYIFCCLHSILSAITHTLNVSRHILHYC